MRCLSALVACGLLLRVTWNRGVLHIEVQVTLPYNTELAPAFLGLTAVAKCTLDVCGFLILRSAVNPQFRGKIHRGRLARCFCFSLSFSSSCFWENCATLDSRYSYRPPFQGHLNPSGHGGDRFCWPMGFHNTKRSRRRRCRVVGRVTHEQSWHATQS